MATSSRFIAKNGLDGNSKTIINVSDPINNTDVSTKQWTANNYINKTGDTGISGNLSSLGYYKSTISGGSAGFILDNAAGNLMGVLSSRGGLNRWLLTLGTSDAETGSDAGSNFRLAAYSDTGTLIDYPITINRATGGLFTLTRPLTISTGNLTVSNGNLVLLNGMLDLNTSIAINTSPAVASFSFKNPSKVLRWSNFTTNTETGTGNAGSDWLLRAYDDTGATIGNALLITRSNLNATFGAQLTATQFNGSGAGITSLTLPIGSINATGTASSATYLRGDGSWAPALATGIATTDDTTTNATYYPVIETSTSSGVFKTSSSKLSFNPSTGTLTTTIGIFNGQYLSILRATPASMDQYLALGSGLAVDYRIGRLANSDNLTFSTWDGVTRVTRATLDTSGILTINNTIINSSSNPKIMSQPTSSTDYALFQAGEGVNGFIYFGRENSAGTGFGATPYAGVLYTTGTKPFQIMTNGSVRMSIDGTSGATNLSSQLQITYANPDVQAVLLQATTGTNAVAMKFTNTGGNAYIGLDNSAGGRLFASGGQAYALGIITESTQPIIFGTANTARLSISGTGVVATSSTITCGGNLWIGANSTLYTSLINLQTASSSNWTIGIGDSTGSAFGITCDFGTFSINKINGNVTTPGSFIGSGSGLTGTLIFKGEFPTANSQDFNSITAQGHYDIVTGNYAGILNAPTALYGTMLVLGQTNFFTQFYDDYSSSKTFIRNYYGPQGWHAWRQIITTNEVGSYSSANGNTWPYVPVVKSDGVMEVGKYLDFHDSSNDGVDYSIRIYSNGGLLYTPSIYSSGTITSTSAISASTGIYCSTRIYSGGVSYSPATGSTVTVDCSQGNTFFINLPASGTAVTFNTPTNPASYQVINIIITQGSSVATTITWPANTVMKWASGTKNISSALNSISMISMVYTGSYWLVTSAKDFS